MNLYDLYKKKDSWQEDTFNQIKNDLVPVKDNKFVRYNGNHDTHLVTVYGKSQIGKTTLILNMIGLKDEETCEKVSTVLRGGVPRGNSSTSTAIYYSKSDTDKYGYVLQAIGEEVFPTEALDEESMKNRLIEIRKKVECNAVGANCISHIYIPNKYFIENDDVEHISILDLPGVESRNTKETEHVESLMNKYLPSSSVCIIVCSSNEIQSLEKLTLPNNIDWRYRPDQFVIALTRSYSQGNIKTYFEQERANRDKDFLDFIKDTYSSEIRGILGENNKFEIYPIEVGQSFNQLCNAELKNESDREEVRKVKDKMLEDLIKSIKNHKGEHLSLAIKDLRANVYKIDEKEITKLNSTIANKENEKANFINQQIYIHDYLQRLKVDLSDLDRRIKKCEDFEKQISGFGCSFFSFQAIKRLALSKKLYSDKGGKEWIKAGKEEIIIYLRDRIQFVINRNIPKLTKMIDNFAEEMDDNSHEIKLSESDLMYEMDGYLDCIIKFRINFIPKKKFCFWKSKKAEFSENVITDMNSSLNSKFKDHFKTMVSVVSKIKEKEKVEKASKEKKIEEKESKINELSDWICSIELDIQQQEKRLDSVKKRLEKDESILKDYLYYAEKAYMKQRDDVIKDINSAISREDKLRHVLFLGILEKDYNKVINK